MADPNQLLMVIAVVALLTAGVAGCGSSGADREQLTIGAASSLRIALAGYRSPGESGAPPPRISFAGSDLIASQIRQGVGIDVFAAASTDEPDGLLDDGLVETPVEYASNRVVLAVPTDSGIDSIGDLTEPDLSLVVGDRSVPVGAYTREILSRLPGAEGQRIEANVKSEEPDVASITAKLVQGAADAGFIYATDALSVPGEIRAIELPSRLQPKIVYSAAVVDDTDQPEEARQYIDGLLSGAGANALEEAGFLPPP